MRQKNYSLGMEGSGGGKSKLRRIFFYTKVYQLRDLERKSKGADNSLTSKQNLCRKTAKNLVIFILKKNISF